MLALIRRVFEFAIAGVSWATTGRPYTLVVVDMQPEFCPDSLSSVAAKVAAEIRYARERGLPIVIVEYKPKAYGSTHRSLTRLLDGYRNTVTVEKRGMDGSRAVLKACAGSGFSTALFRVCGVYTHYCVEETVIGLVKKRKRTAVSVVKRACSDPSGNRWECFPALANVQLV